MKSKRNHTKRAGRKPKTPVIADDVEIPVETLPQKSNLRSANKKFYTKSETKRKLARGARVAGSSPRKSNEIKENSESIFDWSESDKKGILELFSVAKKKNGENKNQQRIIKKQLVDEILEIYRKKRIEYLGNDYFRIDKKFLDSAFIFAISCLGYDIKPTEIIDYWAGEVSKFSSLKFPPLHFLSSSKNMDNAICSIKSAVKKRKKREAVNASDWQDFEDDYERLIEKTR